MHVKVKVIAGARKEKVVRVKEGSFEISVREPAERNLANKRIKELLAEQFTVPAKSIKIVTGHHSPGKMFDVPVEE